MARFDVTVMSLAMHEEKHLPWQSQKTDRNEARTKMDPNDTDEHIRWSSTHPTDETGEPTPDLL